jgi:hypothetical protein
MHSGSGLHRFHSNFINSIRRNGLRSLQFIRVSKTKSRRNDFRMRPKTIIRLAWGTCRVGVMDDE